MDSKLLGIALASWMGLGTRTGHAEILLPGATLNVHSSAGSQNCIDEERLGAKIRAQLTAQITAVHAPAQRKLEVTISDGSKGLVAELRVSGLTQGIRRIEAARCPGLADALAVTVAMILDRDAHALREQASTPPNPEQAPVPSAQPNPPGNNSPASVGQSEQSAQRDNIGSQDKTSTNAAADSGASLTSNMEVRGWLGAGLGTWKTWNIETGVAVFAKSWGLELGAFYLPAIDHELGNGHVRVSTVGGLTAGCLRHGTNWRATLCLRAMAGAERVRGIGYDQEQSTMLPTLSVGPSVGIEVGSRWILGLNLFGQVDLFKDDYVVENEAGTLKTPPIVAWLVARVALSSRNRAQ